MAALLKNEAMKRLLFLLLALFLVTSTILLEIWNHERNRDILKNEQAAAEYVSWGMSLCDKGDNDGAIHLFEQASGFDPSHPYIDDAFGRAYAGRKDFRRALQFYMLARQQYALDAFACDGLARIFATAPDPLLRNGAQAVSYAEQARDLSNGNVKDVLDTLAAAEAEDGRFAAAVEAEDTYLQSPDLDAGMRAAAQTRRELYLHHQPFHQL